MEDSTARSPMSKAQLGDRGYEDENKDQYMLLSSSKGKGPDAQQQDICF